MRPNVQFPADLVTFTKKKSLMENRCAHLCKFNPFCTNVSSCFIKALQELARNTEKR